MSHIYFRFFFQAMKRLSFDGCKNDSWRVTNVSLESAGDKINVVADIANGSVS